MNAISIGSYPAPPGADAASVIAELTSLGLDAVTDGQVTSRDPIARVASALAGVEVSGPVPAFGGRMSHREIRVTGDVRYKGPIFLDDAAAALRAARKPLRVALVGPWTLANLARDEHYRSVPALAKAIALALKPELDALLAAGVAVVQFDEPCASCGPMDAAAFMETYKALLIGSDSARVDLYAPFGDPGLALPVFEKLCVGGFGADLASRPECRDAALAAVRRVAGQRFIAGIVDGRDPRPDPAERRTHALDGVIRFVDPEQVLLAPSCGLDRLPRDAARRKLETLCEMRNAAALGKT